MSQGLFVSLYESGQPFALIDTRERRDFVYGHWFGSINVPLSVLAARISRLIPDRSFPIHLLDWQDKAIAAATSRLASLGYGNVISCPTALPETYGEGFVKGEYVWSKAFGEVVARTAGLPEVTPAGYLAEQPAARLFDVRPTAEYNLFTIPGSSSLPNSLLLANMQALKNTGEKVLLHCAGRTRSIIGACTLKAAGYDGPYAIFRGGTQAWQLDGLEREFDANRLFATESDDTEPATDFLRKWDIGLQQLNQAELAAFVKEFRDALLFDVSDDAATGQPVEQGIVRISGTNLVQQTDLSIARYHVPVYLFDVGSLSRAAFAAYWLSRMGFDVHVVSLSEPLGENADEKATVEINAAYRQLSAEQLLTELKNAVRVIDFRPSGNFAAGHIKGSLWANVSELLVSETPAVEAVTVIGANLTHASEVADLLAQSGWQIAGIFGWDKGEVKPSQIDTAVIASAIDECALFAGRHHGNMQDSRDYLAWEEELPGQIDQPIHQLWLRLLEQTSTN